MLRLWGSSQRQSSHCESAHSNCYSQSRAQHFQHQIEWVQPYSQVWWLITANCFNINRPEQTVCISAVFTWIKLSTVHIKKPYRRPTTTPSLRYHFDEATSNTNDEDVNEGTKLELKPTHNNSTHIHTPKSSCLNWVGLNVRAKTTTRGMCWRVYYADELPVQWQYVIILNKNIISISNAE